MKKIKLTKGIIIILVTLFVIALGAVIVGNLSNDDAMAVEVEGHDANCGYIENESLAILEVVPSEYNSSYHVKVCNACGNVIQLEQHTLVRKVRKVDDTYHEWYYGCTKCWYGTLPDTTGKHSSADPNDCEYCQGSSEGVTASGSVTGGSSSDGTCNPCTSYDEVYVTKNDEVHACYRVCTECGNEWYDADYIHKYESYTDNGDGTHTANCKRDCGYTLVEDCNFEDGVCTECGATDECEHNWEISEYPWAYDDIDEEYNHKTKHAYWYECSLCGEEGDWASDTIEDHSWGTIVDNNDGTHSLTCSECGYYGETDEEGYYQLTEAHTEEEIPAVEATCTTAGSTAGAKCSVCDAIITEPTTIDALGHTEEEIPAVEATCTTAGSTAGVKCSVCDEILTEPTTIDALGHTEEEIPAVEATCTTAGSTAGVKCSVCDEIITEPTTILATGHNYENGECVNCGETETQEEQLEVESDKYELDETYLSQVQAGITIEELKTELSTNAVEIKIYNQDNEEISDTEKIGTGMRIEFIKGEETKEFTIIVKGDSNGDGEADFKDIVKINQARLNRATLDTAYSLAADVNGDGEVDFKDMVKINRFRLNKITEL